MPEAGALLNRIVDLIDSGGLILPVFDPITLKLQQAIASGTEDIGEFEKLILQDQALAAEVLRAANSPFYCGLSPVKTIRNAIVRLGTHQMRRIVILVSERNKYKAKNPALQKMLFELWRHASTTALGSQWLSKRLHSTGIEEICFLGGLLHDIGKLVILRAVDHLTQPAPGAAAIPRGPLDEVLLAAHCQIGHQLLMKWNVPEIYCQIARDHHSEDLSSGDLPLTIVRLANNGSRKLGLGLDPAPSMDIGASPEAGMLNVQDELLSELESMLEEHLSVAA
jgi:HD-like signal output (HDOD) protein